MTLCFFIYLYRIWDNQCITREKRVFQDLNKCCLVLFWFLFFAPYFQGRVQRKSAGYYIFFYSHLMLLNTKMHTLTNVGLLIVILRYFSYGFLFLLPHRTALILCNSSFLTVMTFYYFSCRFHSFAGIFWRYHKFGFKNERKLILFNHWFLHCCIIFYCSFLFFHFVQATAMKRNKIN